MLKSLRILRHPPTPHDTRTQEGTKNLENHTFFSISLLYAESRLIPYKFALYTTQDALTLVIIVKACDTMAYSLDVMSELGATKTSKNIL